MTDTFDAQFDLFRHVVFRPEALPAYDVGEADAQRWAAFVAGQPLSERSVDDAHPHLGPLIATPSELLVYEKPLSAAQE